MNAQNQHILVVDDDARLRDLLSRYLGEQGFTLRNIALDHGGKALQR